EPVRDLLHAVPRLRRPWHGRGPAARRSDRRRLARAQPGRCLEPGRDGDAERPALQHDLERLQHHDGLRGPDPPRRSLGDRPLRARAAAQPERVARRYPAGSPQWHSDAGGTDAMTALQKSLHPDEKYQAGKLGGSLSKIGAAILVVFLALSILLGW